MSDNRNFTNEELVAYLDGEQEFAPIHEIEQALKSDPALQARIDALSVDKQKISSAFDGLLDQDNTPNLPSEAYSFEPDAGGSSGSWRQIAAVAVIALALGALGGNFLTDNRDMSWQSHVATYQALYGNVTLAHIDQSEDAAVKELTRVSKAIGKELKLTDLNSYDEFTYKRSQVLVFEGRPLAQMTFLSENGSPIALCLIRSDENQSSHMNVGEMEGMKSAIWSKDGFDFLMIGTDDPELIERAAKYFSARI